MYCIPVNLDCCMPVSLANGRSITTHLFTSIAFACQNTYIVFSPRLKHKHDYCGILWFIIVRIPHCMLTGLSSFSGDYLNAIWIVLIPLSSYIYIEFLLVLRS